MKRRISHRGQKDSGSDVQRYHCVLSWTTNEVAADEEYFGMLCSHLRRAEGYPR